MNAELHRRAPSLLRAGLATLAIAGSGCLSDPVPEGFPDASNTGVPAGTTLTPYDGPMVITTNDTVIDAKTITGDLRIQAANVLIKRSQIFGDVRIDADDTGFSFRIEDSEVDAGDAAGNDSYDGTGIGARDFVAVRVNVHGGKRSINCFLDCTVQDSYLHDQAADPTGTAHESAIRMGKGSRIIHNTLWCNAPTIPPDAGCSANLTGYGDFAVVEQNLIQHNLFKATTGGTCAYGGSSGKGVKPYADGANNIRFIGNVFERGAGGDAGGPNCGYWFAIADFDPAAPGNQWQDNTWEDGTPLDP